jgi:hypothetical protein
MKRLQYQIWVNLALLCFIFNNVAAQEVLFEKKFGVNGWSEVVTVLETKDGGLLMIGYTDANTAGLSDFHLIKTDAFGNEVWTLTHGGFNNDIPLDGIELQDSSFVIVGYTGSFTSSPSRDVYLVKVDPKGKLVWTKSIGGSQTDEGTGIKQTSDGGFIISALTQSFGAGSTDAWLVKTDNMGDTLWTQTFGGVTFDDAWDVEIAPDGGFVLTGGTYSLASGSEDDLWLIKTDSNGNAEWIETFGSTNIVDWGWDVTVVADGFVVVGLSNYNPTVPPASSGDAYFIKTDFQGNLVWDKTITHAFRLEATSINVCKDGGFILGGTKITGPTESNFWITRTNSSGVVLWTKEMGVDFAINRINSVIQTDNQDIVAAGYGGYTPTNDPKMHLIRLKDTTASVGIRKAELEQNQLTVFPNPSKGKVFLNLEGDAYKSKTIQVLSSASGQLVRNLEVSDSNALSIELNTAGLYLIRVLDNEGHLLGSAKLMVSN